MAPILGPFSLERLVRAVEKVRERLLRGATALENAAIPYAVCGGNAVAVWVTRVDEAAVRNTRDVDILIAGQTLMPSRLPCPRPALSTSIARVSTCFSMVPTPGPVMPFTSSSLARRFAPKRVSPTRT